MRRLGMKFGNEKLYDPLNMLFTEGYYEMMLAIALETVAFKRYSLAYFFNQADDKTNSLIAFIIIFYVAFLSFKITKINIKYSGKLKKSVKKKYKIYFEGISNKNNLNAFEKTFFILRRLLQVLALVLLNSFPIFQSLTFTSLSLINLIFILKFNPFESKSKNRIEAINECLILLASYFVFCWQYSNPNLVDAKGEN